MSEKKIPIIGTDFKVAVEDVIANKAPDVSSDFIRQLAGYGLTTATILYRIPDYKEFLQTYIWQEYDLAPKFPTLTKFLDFWKRELDGPLHSVTVAHERLIKPAEIKAVNGVLTLH